MSRQHATETLGFNSFSGYYGSIPAGYGGLDFSAISYLNATYWTEGWGYAHHWCDTGYQNVISGAGEAYTWDTVTHKYSYGVLETSTLKETFTLQSMVAASAWETNQPFTFYSFTYQEHRGFVMKNVHESNGNTVYGDTWTLSQTAQTIDFAKPPSGFSTDFKNIAAVLIKSGAGGAAGNTCTYGTSTATYGTQMAFDNLKIKWNGKIPSGAGGKELLARPHGHTVHTPAPHLVSPAHADATDGNHVPALSHAADPASYHTELVPPYDAHQGNLTPQFQLPAVEHFGT
jgi:hypothetical protein